MDIWGTVFYPGFSVKSDVRKNLKGNRQESERTVTKFGELSCVYLELNISTFLLSFQEHIQRPVQSCAKLLTQKV